MNQSRETTFEASLLPRLTAGRSLWRYPSNTGQVPRYMQRLGKMTANVTLGVKRKGIVVKSL